MRDVVGVVLAAGLGMRLRPATELCPKPLLPVGGIEPLFFALWKAHQLGVRNFVVNAHHLPDQVVGACAEYQQLLSDSKIEVLVEGPEILGTGGALQNIFKKVFKNFAPKDVFVQNGDTLSQFDLHRVVEFKNHSAFAISERKDHAAKYNMLWLNTLDEFIGVGSQWQQNAHRGVHFLGSYKIAASDIEFLMKQLPEKIVPIDLFTAIFEPLKNAGRAPQAVCIFEQDEADRKNCFWFDMTNEAFLLEAQSHVTHDLSAHSLWGHVLKARYPNGKFVSEGAFGWVPEGRQVVLPRASVVIDPNGALDEKSLDLLGECSSLVVSSESGKSAPLILNEAQENFSTVVRCRAGAPVRLHDLSHTVRVISNQK